MNETEVSRIIMLLVEIRELVRGIYDMVAKSSPIVKRYAWLLLAINLFTAMTAALIFVYVFVPKP